MVGADIEIVVGNIHIEQAVDVVAEPNVDIHFAFGARGDFDGQAAEFEVVFGGNRFALQDAQFDFGLVVGCRAVAFFARYGYGHVAFDNRAENAVGAFAVAQVGAGFDAEREGHDVG